MKIFTSKNIVVSIFSMILLITFCFFCKTQINYIDNFITSLYKNNEQHLNDEICDNTLQQARVHASFLFGEKRQNA